VASKHFKNPARREWWSVHIEAWQRSGLSQRRYCRIHRLTGTTFTRWLRAITDAEVAKIRAQTANILAETERDERRKQRNGRPLKLSRDKRSQAVQAFWAMHVETLNWSGITLTHYAAAVKISKFSLRRWRDLIDGGEVEIDWRAQRHPSARPQISTSASSAAKESAVERDLTDATAAGSARDGRASRRSFTSEEKLAIVLKCEQPGNSVSAVAHAYRLATSALFRWRAEFAYGRKAKAELAPVVLSSEQSTDKTKPHPAALALHMLPLPRGMTAIDLPDGRRVFAPEGSDPDVVRRHVAERETTR
jgi:transposase-like protein